MESFDYNERYLQLLARSFPTVQKVSTELINLQAILDLPKGTEHFMSDIHGEDEAFLHILNNASGLIREQVDHLYGHTVSEAERAEIATLIYYPKDKLAYIKRRGYQDMDAWYRTTLYRLIDICRAVSSKYTRSKVRKALPEDFAYIIDELLHTNYEGKDKELYYHRIISTIIEIQRADAFIEALAQVIKRLAVDRLHIIGDVFDRGPRADKIMDMLRAHHSVDIQWGNHDILWMGAAAGSAACIFNILNISVKYANLEMLESGYGISLRHLISFAHSTYGESSCFTPKVVAEGDKLSTVCKLHKAVAILQFKLEGQVIRRNPQFEMEDRLLLDKIDYDSGTVVIGGERYPLKDHDFPTVDRSDPYALTEEEAQIVEELVESFRTSIRLQEHVRFLYSAGSLYLRFNSNLLYHGCVPLNEDGSYAQLEIDGIRYGGLELMDLLDQKARAAYFERRGSRERERDCDLLWYLWCGSKSPLFGRDRMTTFERYLIADEATWKEPKNPYYTYTQDPAFCCRLLEDFGLDPQRSHIINGHMPVRIKDGESPIRGGGKMLIIDGGFSRAYQKTTGIAGYTLIYNSHGLRLVSHQPFKSRRECVCEDSDILSTSVTLEYSDSRQRVADTDIGHELRQQIFGLTELLAAYRSGAINEMP